MPFKICNPIITRRQSPLSAYKLFRINSLSYAIELSKYSLTITLLGEEDVNFAYGYGIISLYAMLAQYTPTEEIPRVQSAHGSE